MHQFPWSHSLFSICSDGQYLITAAVIFWLLRVFIMWRDQPIVHTWAAPRMFLLAWRMTLTSPQMKSICSVQMRSATCRFQLHARCESGRACFRRFIVHAVWLPDELHVSLGHQDPAWRSFFVFLFSLEAVRSVQRSLQLPSQRHFSEAAFRISVWGPHVDVDNRLIFQMKKYC